MAEQRFPAADKAQEILEEYERSGCKATVTKGWMLEGRDGYEGVKIVNDPKAFDRVLREARTEAHLRLYPLKEAKADLEQRVRDQAQQLLDKDQQL